MPSLFQLRRELRPMYGHYTDAVVSLIGLQPSEAILEAARQGNLNEVHRLLRN